MSTDLVLTYVAFFAMAAIALVGALLAVNRRNLLHAALGLILAFMGVAGIYFILEAEFVAVVQIVIYIGAIAVLILFAVMLTRGLMRRETQAENGQWIAAAVVAVLLFAALFFVTIGTTFPTAPAAITGDLIPKLGTELLTTYVLPFEMVSLLLLAALVGAIVIARD